MSNSGTQTGHDAPVTDRSEDFYDRWPVARSISRIIATAPPQWSTRIGLFGLWGDGKTSVLNFLEQQQREAGNIVIRYAPWGASTPDEVWRDFGQVLISGLKQHEVKLPFFKRAGTWARTQNSKISTGVKAASELAELTGHAPGAAVGGAFASTLISEKLTFTGEQIKKLAQDLGGRKVVVFIDDLDRTDAVVIPKLLLVLRELLDFSQFAFVLAFDQKIVATALERGNVSWGNSGQSFLDKVIDFRVELPKPTTDQIRRLALAQFGKLCSFVPQDAVEDIARLLPVNPRKLKLLARTIASTKDEVSRHEANELEWNVILLLALIRTEGEAFANRLLELTLNDDSPDWLAYIGDSDSTQKKWVEEQKKLLEEFPELKPREDRMKVLTDAWREAIPSLPTERIRYQAIFALSPHCITWGEFKQFYRTWRSSKQIIVVRKFVVDRMNGSEARRETVEKELVESILGHYSTVLEKASEVKSKADHLALMSEGSDALDLLLQCATGSTPVCAISHLQMQTCWEQLLKIALQWRHFNANENEPELRAKEIQALMNLGGAMDDPMFVYEKLNPRRLSDVFVSAREARLANEMIDTIRAAFAPAAIDAALSYVSRPGEIKKIRSREEHQAARFLLTAPTSPMFATQKSVLMAAFEARKGTPNVVGDANEYLLMLLSALEHGDNWTCTAAERKDFIAAHPDFMCLIWSLCVSEPSQFRMLSGLRRQKQILLEAGMPDALLNDPEWLKEEIPVQTNIQPA
jgi:hypothetical protein